MKLRGGRLALEKLGAVACFKFNFERALPEVNVVAIIGVVFGLLALLAVALFY